MTEPLVRSHEGQPDDGGFDLDSERANEGDARALGAGQQYESRLEVARSEPSIPCAEVADPEHAVKGRIAWLLLEQR